MSRFYITLVMLFVFNYSNAKQIAFDFTTCQYDQIVSNSENDKYYLPDGTSFSEGAITLTTHNLDGSGVRFWMTNTGTHSFRVNNKSGITISCNGGVITAIELTGSNYEYLQGDGYSNGILRGSVDNITLVNSGYNGKTGTAQIKNITVTYEDVTANIRHNPDMAFSEKSVIAYLGEGFVAPILTKSTTAEVIYSSDKESVATVNAKTGKVTLVGEGTARITAKAEANDDFYEGLVSYTLTVRPAKVVGAIFSSELGEEFSFENPEGIAVWSHDSRYGLKASAYSNSWSYATTAVAFASVDLTHMFSATLTFRQCMNHFRTNDDIAYAKLVVREEGETEWTDIGEPTTPETYSWAFYDNTPVDLTAYCGKKIDFGFKYISTNYVAGTWEINNINIVCTTFSDGALSYILTDKDAIVSSVENKDLYSISIPDYIFAPIKDGESTYIPVTGVFKDAFRNCIQLTSIEIPSTITKIGTYAFWGCCNLIELKIASEVPPVIDGSVFDVSMYSNTSLIVPSSSDEIYRTSMVWKNFKNISTYTPLKPSVTVLPQSVTLIEGEIIELKAILKDLPENATITWTSSNNDIAYVSIDGMVVAIAAGSVIITANCQGYTATTSVVVNKPLNPSIEVTPNEFELKVGEYQQLTATLTDMPLNSVVNWSSQDKAIAMVDNNGVVFAVGEGVTNIIASCNDIECMISVKVTRQLNPTIFVTPETIELTEGETAKLVAILIDMPENTTITWISSDKTVAMVDVDGVVFAVGEGSAVITANCLDYTATVSVVVNRRLNPSIEITPNKFELKVGESQQLTAILTDMPLNSVVNWVSQDKAIAMVDNDGFVFAVGEGITNIIASCDGIECMISVRVTRQLNPTIFVTPETIELTESETAKLVATLIDMPENIEITWISSDKTVAMVDVDGVVFAVGEGSAVITANCLDYTATVSVIVNRRLNPTIKVTPNELELKVGDTQQLTATLTDMPINSVVNWVSQDKEIAIVDKDGVVFAVGEGTVAITAFCNDLGDSVTVKVISDDNKEDGIFDINCDIEIAVYTLSGVKVGNSIEGLAKGVYIVRQGANTTKVAI